MTTQQLRRAAHELRLSDAPLRVRLACGLELEIDGELATPVRRAIRRAIESIIDRASLEQLEVRRRRRLTHARADR